MAHFVPGEEGQSMIRRLLGVLLATAIVPFVGPTARAQFTIGPGTSIPNDGVDTPATGGRINVDQGNSLLLAPGTYRATRFNYDAGVSGDVAPFLAVSNGTNSYQVLALGNTVNVPAVQTDQSVPFGGSDLFTLSLPTVVYAGISSLQQNPIFLDEGTAANTDHDAPAGGPLSTVVVGGTIENVSNADLGRSYAFSVNVDVPEPSSVLGLMLTAAAGLILRRGHKRRAN